MTKLFCDICGSPATEAACAEVVKEHGEAWISYVSVSADKKQPKIAVQAVFLFRDHPTGFGGPPDLCKKCVSNLLHDLWADHEDRRQEEAA